MSVKTCDYHIGIFRFSEWRLIPVYSSRKCVKGCHTSHLFTWLFLFINVVTGPDVGEDHGKD